MSRPDEIPVAPTMLFQFALPCYSSKVLWKAGGTKLTKKFELPRLCELEGEKPYGDLRLSWNEDGLVFFLTVKGKKQDLECQATEAMKSDGLHLFIDTRDTHNVHRASRFCHHFVFLPAGSGKKNCQPWAQRYSIHRAREHPSPAKPDDLDVIASVQKTGYQLFGRIGRDAMMGYDPEEHKQLGFSYLIVDQELGEQSLAMSSEYPVRENPSLWQTIDLVK